MQPGVTVALATVWLAGAVGVLSATLQPSYPSLDQYSPRQPPNHHQVTKGPQGHANWKFQEPSEDFLAPKIDQTLSNHLQIETTDLKTSRGAFHPNGSSNSSHESSFGQEILDISFKDGIENKTPSEDLRKVKDKVQEQIFDAEKATHKKELFIAQKKKATFQRENSDEYDSFHDQGPGSIEIYTLDLFGEDSLFDPKLSTKAKSKLEENVLKTDKSREDNKKANKKAEGKKGEIDEKGNRLRSSDKANETLSILDKIIMSLMHKENIKLESNFSNQLEENLKNKAFGVGGVPELQVGCEGVEATFRYKRSASEGSKDENQDVKFPFYAGNALNMQLVYQSDPDEQPEGESYEERDELIKLRKLESDSYNPPSYRGDIPVQLYEEYSENEKLPVRGDLASAFTNGDWHALDQKKQSVESKEKTHLSNGRKLLSVSGSLISDRQKRNTAGWDGVMWGFGEDDGIMPNDEIQTDERRREGERRKQERERRREYGRQQTEQMNIRHEEEKRKNPGRNNDYRKSEDRNGEEERIRREYQRRLEEREREIKMRDERERRRQHEERRRLDEEGRTLDHQGSKDHNEAERRRHNEGRRLQEEQERLSEHRRNWPIDNRKPEEERRRHSDRRRHEEERRRHEEQRKEAEDNRRRIHDGNLVPSNLMHPNHRRPDGRHEEANERKLKGYMQRNTPIVVGSRRSSDEARKRALEERRNEPENQMRARHPYDSNHQGNRREPVWLEQKRAMESTREYDISHFTNHENGRSRGPSPPNGVGYVNRMSDVRRRPDVKRMGEEEERKILDEERRLEEEDRKRKSGRYEEDRKWHQRVRQQAERMRQEWMDEANRRSQAERKPNWNVWYPPTQTAPNEKGYQYLPPDPNNKGYQPPPDLNNKGYQPPLNLNSKGYQPTPDLNNKGYQPPLDPNNKGYQPPLDPNNKGYQPPLDLNNKGYQPPLDLNNKGYQPPSDLNNKGYQPPPDLNNKGYQPPLDLNNKGYQPPRVNSQFEQDRQRLEHLRRMEYERQARNREQENRYQEQKKREESVRSLEEQRRRQEEERLKALPVSATIIVRPGGSGTNSSSPLFFSRGNFGSEIDFPGISPNKQGIMAARFPAPVTRKPPVKGPRPCIWAILNCCPATARVVSCFESLGCPGVNWDSNPCNPDVTHAARIEVGKFYAAANQSRKK